MLYINQSLIDISFHLPMQQNSYSMNATSLSSSSITQNFQYTRAIYKLTVDLSSVNGSKVQVSVYESSIAVVGYL